MKKGDCLHGDSIPKLEVAMDYIKKELGEIKTDLKSHIAEEDAMMHRVEDRFIKWMADSENRFASKQTERIVYAILALLFTGMSGTLLVYILQHVGIVK